jgi:acyl-coenzyme A thioesterase PaaI-like protein
MNPLDGRIFGERNRCFGCGPDHPHGFRLHFHVEGDEVVTEFTPGEGHEGVPTLMHGGLATTVADEIGAWALIALRDRFGFTGTMTSRFPRPIRIGQPVQGRGRIVKENARAVYVEVRLLQGGVECFTSSMTFMLLDAESAERMVGTPMPDTLRRFFRARTSTSG